MNKYIYSVILCEWDKIDEVLKAASKNGWRLRTMTQNVNAYTLVFEKQIEHPKEGAPQ